MRKIKIIIQILSAAVLTAAADECLLYASADATVRASSPDTNFGSEAGIQIRANSGDTNMVYLKIDASGLGSRMVTDIVSIEAYALPASTPRAAKVMLLAAPDAEWDENGITWNNAPANDRAGKGLLGRTFLQIGNLVKPERDTAQTVSIDWSKGESGAGDALLAALNGGSRTATLVLCPSDANQRYASKEGTFAGSHPFRVTVSFGPVEYRPPVIPGQEISPDAVLLQSPVLSLIPDAGRQPPDRNPPVLRWPLSFGPPPYTVTIGRSPDMTGEKILQGPVMDTLIRPFKAFEPGVWYWRVAASDGTESAVASFEISPDLPVWEIPSWDELMASVPKSHPRIYMRPETLPRLRALAAGEYKNMVEARKNDVLLNVVGRDIPDLPVNAGIGSKWFGKQEKAYVNGPVRRLVELGHLYCITQDERFADEIYRRTLHFLQYSINELASPRRNDFANTWVIASFAIAYDAIYDRWSPAERDRLAAAILERIEAGIREYLPGSPGDQQQLNSGSHAWQWTIRNMTIGALALLDEYPQAREYFEWSLKLHASLYPWYGGADGGSAEGLQYYEGTGFHTTAEAAALFGAATGLNLFDNPWYRNTLGHVMYARGLGTGVSQFGDQSSVSIAGPKVFYTTRLFAGKTGNPWFSAYWDELSRRYGDGYTDDDSLCWMELFLDPLSFAEPVSLAEMPKARLFRDIGLVAMRSDIGNPENDILFEFKSSPYGSAGAHAHADQNSFNINAYGDPLVIDSGYKDAVGSEHHKSWTRLSKAHNTILVNGTGQTPRSWEAYGRIIDFEEGETFVRTAGSAPAGYQETDLKRFDRHVVWLKPDTWLIVDNLEAREPSSFQWLLHASNRIQIDSAKKELLLQTEKAEARVTFFSPDRLNFAQDNQFPVDPGKRPDKELDLDAMTDQWHLTASSVEPARQMQFVTVIQVCPFGKKSMLPVPNIEIDEKSVALSLGDGRHGMIRWE